MSDYRQYPVRGKLPLIERISDALASAGVEVLSTPTDEFAPFRFLVRTPEGEDLTLIVYAFLANKYTQKGRPPDEHRFQIKYGSDFHVYHDIYIDPRRTHVTLMLGVHIDAGVFVAIDPAMHNPTWFSASVEFKDEHVQRAQQTGWTGWERERSMGRRKRDKPQFNCETECVVAFKADRFLRYVHFERLATGMDAGERLLLAERMERDGVDRLTAHALERQFGLTARQILDVISGHFRLATAVRGSVAEHHLRTHLLAVPEISEVSSLDKDGQPDFEVRCRSGKYRIECKNVLRRESALGPRVDFQKTRASKRDPCSRYYPRDAFEILAACLHPVTERWEYRFCLTKSLDAHSECPGRLAHRVVVAGHNWTSDIVRLVS